MRVEEIKKEIDHLDVSEKLTLIEAVWDEIAQSNQELPLPEWQKKELSERLFLYKDASIKTKDGTKVHEDLRNKYK
jgi:putative addiction module component (TIGR02574 family)